MKLTACSAAFRDVCGKSFLLCGSFVKLKVRSKDFEGLFDHK